MALVFLSSGLLLGWSLGANGAGNILGTAVGARMLSFKTAAVICAVFVVLGAVVSGMGTSATLVGLGPVNTVAGSFMVALAAGVTVFVMTKFGLPVSTAQAMVGAILGWNVFAGIRTDLSSLTRIVGGWIASPILTALFAILLFLLLRRVLLKVKVHLLRLDFYVRIGLMIACALGAYGLGANNIANAMGVFVPVSPFRNVAILDHFIISSAQILFLIGGLAIALGIFTYSQRVIKTVGSGIFSLSPEAALVAVLANGVVLLLFASQGLKNWLESQGLPSLPLVPVSSAHGIIGAVVGIGILKGARGIRYKMLGEIALGWLITPIVAGLISFFSLFFLENVFELEVRRPINTSDLAWPQQTAAQVYPAFSPESLQCDHDERFTFPCDITPDGSCRCRRG